MKGARRKTEKFRLTENREGAEPLGGKSASPTKIQDTEEREDRRCLIKEEAGARCHVTPIAQTGIDDQVAERDERGSSATKRYEDNFMKELQMTGRGC